MDRKIAIIGAGPAGITVALELQDKGYDNITIYGSFREAQLITKKVEGVTFDVAACLLHSGYQHTIIPLAHRFGVPINYIKEPADIVNHQLKPLKKGVAETIEIYLSILHYMIYFFGWLILHKTPFQKRYHHPMDYFLAKRGLEGLANSFVLGPGGTAQGYGFLNEVTAYHAMRWFRPRLFVTPLASKFKKGTATITEGYETLFKKILSGFNHVNEKIETVRPTIGQVELTTKQGKRRLFDEVIIACPLDQINFPHAHLFNKHSIDETTLFSYLFTSPTIPVFKDRAYITDYIQHKAKNKALVIRTGGKTQTGNYLYWAVGYKTEEVTKAALKQLIKKQLTEECQIEIAECHFFAYFRYNLRFSSAAIKDGLPHQLNSLQGYQHIWYSGGLLSHWDISSIYEHNRWLVNKMDYQFNEKTISSFLQYQYNALLSRLRLI